MRAIASQVNRLVSNTEWYYFGPGHKNWSLSRAFGVLDRGNVVTFYCGLFAIRYRRY